MSIAEYSWSVIGSYLVTSLSHGFLIVSQKGDGRKCLKKCQENKKKFYLAIFLSIGFLLIVLCVIKFCLPPIRAFFEKLFGCSCGDDENQQRVHVAAADNYDL
jgi:hypothetical protein